VTDSFLREAGENAEGVVCAYPWNPGRKDPLLAAFRQRFRTRFGVDPDTYASHAYDGMNMLIWAIQEAGLNRAKIRDMLAYRTVPFPGVTGEIPLSACLDDLGEVSLAWVEGGQWKYHAREDLDIPRGPVAPRSRIPAVTQSPPSPDKQAGNGSTSSPSRAPSRD
jgi:ABC-type branched-subunit amino acid transport system substrate-binding protein